MMRTNERGFTALELAIVIALFIILLVVSMLFVRPKTYDAANDDADRRLGLAAMAQGIQEYRSRVGAWPEGLPAAATPIASQEGAYDLCRHIVPGYLQDMAFDPQAGIAYTGGEDDPQPAFAACNAEGVQYTTGYTIRKNSDNSVTLAAPAAVTGKLDITVR